MALTLRTRLTVTTAIATVLAAAALVIGLQLWMTRQSATDSSQLLQGRLDAGAATIRFGPDGVRVAEVRSSVLDQELWIFDRSGRRIDGAIPPSMLRPAVAAMARRTTPGAATVSGRFRLASRPVTIRGTHRVGAVVVGAIDLTPYERGESRGLELALLLGFSIVVAAAAAAWVSAGSSLHRVGRMARLADDWREHDLSQRFALGSPSDEITELGDTLDRMLDRIGHALVAERRLTDEVAHELRTPLAAVRAEAELALCDTGDQRMTAEALSAIINGCDRMNASIETMLNAARSVSASTGEGDCRLQETLEELVDRLPPDRPDVRLDPVGSQSADWMVAAPGDVVRAAVSPVLDNALRHARSQIRIRVQPEDRSLAVVVEDDGQGVPPELQDRLFEPGWTARSDGTGLGLPLARRLARSIGGDVEFPSGSGTFVIRLPRRAPSSYA